MSASPFPAAPSSETVSVMPSVDAERAAKGEAAVTVAPSLTSTSWPSPSSPLVG